MRFRLLTAAALAVLAVAGLTACDSKIGQAAVVGGHRISEQTVSSYVTRQGVTAKEHVEPRVEALTYLIQQQILTTLLQDLGSVPARGQLASLQAQVVQQEYQTTTAALRQRVVELGLTRPFADLLLRVGALEAVLGQRVKLQTTADFAKLLAKYGVTVTVSPRYGRWEPSKFQLSPADHAGVPGFIRLLPTTAPAQ